MERKFKKYIQIARDMRKMKNYSIDIRKFDAIELSIIHALATSDNLLRLFAGYESMTLREFCAAMHIYEALEMTKN